MLHHYYRLLLHMFMKERCAMEEDLQTFLWSREVPEEDISHMKKDKVTLFVVHLIDSVTNRHDLIKKSISIQLNLTLFQSMVI